MSENTPTKRESVQGPATCKICFMEKIEDSDPLISPCHCDGSV